MKFEVWSMKSLWVLWVLWQAAMVEGRITWCDDHNANTWCNMMKYVKNVKFLFFFFWYLSIMNPNAIFSTSSKQSLGIFVPAVNHLSPHQDWVEGRMPTWWGTLTSLFLPSDSETQLLEDQGRKYIWSSLKSLFVVSMPSRPLQEVKTTSWGKAKASIQQPHCGFKKD